MCTSLFIFFVYNITINLEISPSSDNIKIHESNKSMRKQTKHPLRYNNTKTFLTEPHRDCFEKGRKKHNLLTYVKNKMWSANGKKYFPI